MKILLTADCMGGVWTYAVELVRALPQHDFVVATLGALPTPSQREALEALPNARLRASNWKLEWMESPWDEVARAGDWLLELEAEVRPDVVHLGGFCHASREFMAPVLVVAHSCVASWWRAVKGEDAPAEWNRYRQEVGAGLRAASHVVAPTQAILAEMQAIYGPFAPASVIWNGSPPATSARAAAQSPGAKPFVLSAGRLWDEAKNVALLGQIAPLLSAPLRIAGAGKDVGGDGEQVAISNLEWLGFLEFPALSQQMEAAAIWAHPARYEPFGLAVLEAAARGCALVLSDIATLRELWDGAALFAAPDDAASWTRQLQPLLDAPDECQAWGEKARARAARYDIEGMAARYEALYWELAALPTDAKK